jgi:hypothetical protein
VRLAIALGALAIGAGGVSMTTLPRPAFSEPSTVTRSVPQLLSIVSARYRSPTGGAVDLAGAPFRDLPLTSLFETANREFSIYGRDPASGRFLVASDKAGHRLYAFDFKNYAWPPRIRPGEREFVFEQPVWAQESNGILYVENAHATYASSSYGQNAYITAIDLKARSAIWRSPPLMANANTFLVTPKYLITGYGFTNEPDFLYLLDRKTGREVDSLPMPTAPERITWQGSLIHVRTYDHDVLVRLSGR